MRKTLYSIVILSVVYLLASFFIDDVMSYLSDKEQMHLNVETSHIDVSLEDFQIGIEDNGVVSWNYQEGDAFDVSPMQNQVVHIRFNVTNQSPFDVNVDGTLTLALDSKEAKHVSNIFFLYPSTMPSSEIIDQLNQGNDTQALQVADNQPTHSGVHIPIVKGETLSASSHPGSSKTYTYKLVMSDAFHDIHTVRSIVLNTALNVGIIVDVNGKNSAQNWNTHLTQGGSIKPNPYLKRNITIELIGDNPLYLTIGEPYTEYGAKVRNEWYETEAYQVSGIVNNQKIGWTAMKYTPTDPDFQTTVKRIVYVTDGEPPIIHAPQNPVVRFVNETLDLKDLVSVSDNRDTEARLRQKLMVYTSLGYSPKKPGTYNICYNVSDDSFLDAQEVCLDLILVAFKDVALMDHSSLALTTHGQVYSWGKNNSGQLGQGSNSEDILKPRHIESLGDVNIVDIEAGSNYAMALSDQGQLYIWGADAYGVQGNDYLHPDNLAPTPILMGETITQMHAAQHTALALNDMGEVYVWGRGASYATGVGNTMSLYSPTKMTFPNNATIQYITQGWGYGFAISTDQQLYAWGTGAQWAFLSNQTVQYSKPTNITSSLPEDINVQDIHMIKGGSAHVAILTKQGDLYTWGLDDQGQLGNGSGRSDMNAPYKVQTTVNQNAQISSIVLGEYTTVGLTSDKTAFAFGKSTNYQLGFVSNVHFPYSLCIPSNSIGVCSADDMRIIAADTSTNITAIVSETGTIYMTGSNINGELGRDTKSKHETWGEIIIVE